MKTLTIQVIVVIFIVVAVYFNYRKNSEVDASGDASVISRYRMISIISVGLAVFGAGFLLGRHSS